MMLPSRPAMAGCFDTLLTLQASSGSADTSEAEADHCCPSKEAEARSSEPEHGSQASKPTPTSHSDSGCPCREKLDRSVRRSCSDHPSVLEEVRRESRIDRCVRCRARSRSRHAGLSRGLVRGASGSREPMHALQSGAHPRLQGHRRLVRGARPPRVAVLEVQSEPPDRSPAEGAMNDLPHRLFEPVAARPLRV